MNQPNIIALHRHVGTSDRFRQHRVTKAVHHMGKFSENSRINIGAVREYKRVYRRLYGTGKLFKRQMLVLHLGGKTPGLEQIFAVPLQGARVHRDLRDLVIWQQPLVNQIDIITLQ